MRRFEVEFDEDERWHHALVIEAETMQDALTVACASPKRPVSVIELPTGQHVQIPKRVKIVQAADIFPRLQTAEKMAQALIRARDALERAADDLGWVDDAEMTLEEFVKPALGSIGVALGQWEERGTNNG